MTEELPDKQVIERIRGLQNQRKEILSLPPEKALERILDAPDPAALVHAFPEEDLYMLVQEIGPEDALPLLALASDRQLDHFLDMEIWDRDKIDLKSTERWMELFFHADPVRMPRWLMDRQTEFTEYYLFKHLEVRIREHDQDPSDFDDDFITLDNVYYFRLLAVPGENKEAEKARQTILLQMLNRMADTDYVKFQKILLEASTVIPAEFEEEAYRLRNVRLAEKGFLPFEEAVGIYQPLKIEDFTTHSEKYVKLQPGGDLPVPLYPSGELKTETLFAAALRHVQSPEILEQLQLEFATLCNQIAVADRKPMRDREALTSVVQKAAGYLSIGLERITGDDRRLECAQSAALIEKFPLSQIFRVGYGLAVSLKWRAEKWRKKSWFESRHLPLTFWGEDWLGVVGGLLLKRPLFYDNYQSGVLYREFENLDDIRKTETVLHSVIDFDNLLDALDIRLEKFAPLVPLTHKNLILTLWVRHYLGLSDTTTPVKMADFKRFFDDLWTGKAEPRQINLTMKEIFLSWLADRSGMTADEISMKLGQTLEDLFREIESEYGKVSKRDLDPRYIHLFLVQD